MLDRMEKGDDYDAVLKEAQDLGYAEADPTADVEGHDVRAKIAIMAKLAYGKTIPNVEDIPCKGISSLTSVDFEYAQLLNCTIKLVGTAVRLSKYGQYDGPLSVYVTPKMVPKDHALAGIRSNGNAVVITSANLGTTTYCGPGAGRFETANSVVADVVRIAATAGGKSSTQPALPFPPEATDLEVEYSYNCPFYVRVPFQESLGIVRRIGELAEAHEVSIHSILQNPIVDRMQADVCVTTESCSIQQMDQFCNALQRQDFCRDPPLWMPLLMDL
mmetsp:Transcript_16814/g.38702  ORF Transcript_16814/g.38702 Transcript_16814/m.38702 type:complete len:274 (-) Transcript_16814:725-1546(-)